MLLQLQKINSCIKGSIYSAILKGKLIFKYIYNNIPSWVPFNSQNQLKITQRKTINKPQRLECSLRGFYILKPPKYRVSFYI